MSLTDKIALVTGSSRGIGRAIALRLAKEGCSVGVNYLSNDWEAGRVAKSIEEMGRKATTFQGDVSNFADAQEMVKKVSSNFGRIDILVNNVGPFLYKTVWDTTVQEWHQILNSNLNSVFYCCKAVVPNMREQKSGVIINVGGPNAERTQGYTRTCACAVAKTGVVVLSKSLAKEEAEYGIRVNVVNPGFIETEAYNEDMRKTMPQQVPMKRLGKPEDVANAVAFLASDEAGYITGAVLNVHGGLWC
ncbi:MAG: 3-oxoacyl-ACP reductase FabG [Candidatus Zixiibacteriota bacterium]|nr:MAG: 3-oxoacyl-ACP reductase FabG [candidate division Zixibacteria bacterium]